MTVRNLTWVLTGEDRSASKALDGVGKNADRLHKRFAILGAGLAGGALGAGLVEFAKKSIEAAVEGEQAQARLAQAVKNTGGSMDELEPKVARLSGQFAKLGFTNDEVETALASMTTATGSSTKALALMGDAADLARYKHIGLADAGTLLARAQGGNLRAFKELGITLRKGVPPAQALQEAMAQLHKRIGGQASAQAGTYAGKMAALHAQFANLSEQVGVKLLPVLVKLLTRLETMASFIERNRKVIEPLAKVFAALVATFWLAAKAAKAFEAVMVVLDIEMDANPIGLVVIAVAALAVGFAEAWKHSQTFRIIVTAAFGGVLEGVHLLLSGLSGLFRALGHVPGFGWATAAANSIDRANRKVNALKNSLLGLPKVTTVTVRARLSGTPAVTALLSGTAGVGSQPKSLDDFLGRQSGGGFKARAFGGPVLRGLTYLVGERGPELFKPRMSGSITNAQKTANLFNSAARLDTSQISDRRRSFDPLLLNGITPRQSLRSALTPTGLIHYYHVNIHGPVYGADAEHLSRQLEKKLNAGVNRGRLMPGLA